MTNISKDFQQKKKKNSFKLQFHVTGIITSKNKN